MKRRVGRVRIDFDVIKRFAAEEITRTPLRHGSESWALSGKSSLHRCKNGSYTLCLIWRSPEGMTLTSTTRGLRLG